MSRAIVVTGTDTDVGKTVFSAALAQATGAFYWKPIQAGIEDGGDSREVSRLTELCDGRVLPEAYRLTSPLSPHRAAELDGIDIDLAAGYWAGLGGMMLDGVKSLAPTGVMLVFAILYFGVMIDAGLFDPLIGRIVAIVEGDPVRILVGTAVLALVVSLDGDGATTYIITTAAMLPLYHRPPQRALHLLHLERCFLFRRASGPGEERVAIWN